MKVMPWNIGACGVEQIMYAGTIKFDTTDVATGVELCELPAGVIITRATAVVKTAFNAATTNVISVGTNDDVNDILASSEITSGTAAAYTANKFIEYNEKKTVKAKYTQTGTAATAGEAEVYIHFVRIPES